MLLPQYRYVRWSPVPRCSPNKCETSPVQSYVPSTHKEAPVYTMTPTRATTISPPQYIQLRSFPVANIYTSLPNTNDAPPVPTHNRNRNKKWIYEWRKKMKEGRKEEWRTNQIIILKWTSDSRRFYFRLQGERIPIFQQRFVYHRPHSRENSRVIRPLGRPVSLPVNPLPKKKTTKGKKPPQLIIKTFLCLENNYITDNTDRQYRRLSSIITLWIKHDHLLLITTRVVTSDMPVVMEDSATFLWR